MAALRLCIVAPPPAAFLIKLNETNALEEVCERMKLANIRGNGIKRFWGEFEIKDARWHLSRYNPAGPPEQMDPEKTVSTNLAAVITQICDQIGLSPAYNSCQVSMSHHRSAHAWHQDGYEDDVNVLLFNHTNPKTLPAITDVFMLDENGKDEIPGDPRKGTMFSLPLEKLRGACGHAVVLHNERVIHRTPKNDRKKAPLSDTLLTRFSFQKSL